MQHIKLLETFYKKQKKELFLNETKKIKEKLKHENISVKSLSIAIKEKNENVKNVLYDRTYNVELLEKINLFLEGLKK
jgi:DNA-dependent RNA polymerase auxiliary subunit epsilon